MSEALDRWTVTLCHCGTASTFPVAVPEAGGPRPGVGTGKVPLPVGDPGGTARTLMLCPAQQLGPAHSWVELAVQPSLGEANREGAGRLPAFLAFSHL